MLRFEVHLIKEVLLVDGEMNVGAICEDVVSHALARLARHRYPVVLVVKDDVVLDLLESFQIR